MNKRELDRAQLNVQDAINKNYPDPDKYDPNEPPRFNRGSKFSHGILLITYLIGSNEEYITTITTETSGGANSETDNTTNGEASNLNEGVQEPENEYNNGKNKTVTPKESYESGTSKHIDSEYYIPYKQHFLNPRPVF